MKLHNIAWQKKLKCFSHERYYVKSIYSKIILYLKIEPLILRFLQKIHEINFFKNKFKLISQNTHIVENREILSQTFLTKISWKWWK